MHRSTLLLLALLAACSGDDAPPGSVTVICTKTTGATVPALLLSNTSSVQTRPDANGHAVLGGIASGATVYLFQPCETCGGDFITAIGSVEPGETLVFGGQAHLPPTVLGSMNVTIAAPPPESFDYYQASTSCGEGGFSASTSGVITVDDRCGGMANVLVRALKRLSMTTFATTSYAYIEAPFVDGGTIDISQWTTYEAVTADLTGSVPYQLVGLSLSNPGLSGDAVLIGHPLLVSVSAHLVGGREDASALVPPVAAQTVDTDTLFAPLLPVSSSSDLHTEFTVDDRGGAFTNYQMLDITYAWRKADRGVLFRFLEDPTKVAGAIDAELPDALRDFRPTTPVTVVALVAHRFDDNLSYRDVHTLLDVLVGLDTPFTRHALSTSP